MTITLDGKPSGSNPRMRIKSTFSRLRSNVMSTCWWPRRFSLAGITRGKIGDSKKSENYGFVLVEIDESIGNSDKIGSEKRLAYCL
jgi:hypothetical protein